MLIPQHHYNPQAFPDDQIEFAASSMAFLVGIHLSWGEQKCRPIVVLTWDGLLVYI